MKTSSFRTTMQKEQSLKDVWGSTSAGATKAVDAYINLRKRVLHGLKGRFTSNELKLLIDNQNGTIFSPDLFSSSQTLIHALEDGIKLDSLDQKWDVDTESFFETIKSLSDSEAYFLREEIDRFWNHMGGDDLNSFVNQFMDDSLSHLDHT